MWLILAAISIAAGERTQALDLSGAPNFRDIGGYLTKDGRRVKAGRVYRSNDLAHLTSEDTKEVAALHIASVVDLRTQEERRQAANVWLQPPVDVYESEKLSLAPVMRSILAGAANAAGARRGLIHFYAGMPDLYRVEYAEFFHRIAAGRLPVLVHCTAGKDRTGVAVALLLASLGVPRQTVLEDYSATDTLLARQPAVPLGGAAQAALAQLPEESRRALWRSDPAYVRAAFNSLDHEYGSLAAYLTRGLSLSADELRMIQIHVLE